MDERWKNDWRTHRPGVAITLGPPARNVGDPSPGIPATVRDVAFRGRGYDHVVEFAGCHRLIGVFHPHRHERGHEVSLQLDAAGCIVFPDEETPEGHSDSSTAAVAEAASGIVTVAGPTRPVAVAAMNG